MPYLTQSEAQRVSAILCKVLSIMTEVSDANIQTMREISAAPPEHQVLTKEMKDRAWVQINRHKARTQRIAKLQATLKRRISWL